MFIQRDGMFSCTAKYSLCYPMLTTCLTISFCDRSLLIQKLSRGLPYPKPTLGMLLAWKAVSQVVILRRWIRQSVVTVIHVTKVMNTLETYGQGCIDIPTGYSPVQSGSPCLAYLHCFPTTSLPQVLLF